MDCEIERKFVPFILTTLRSQHLKHKHRTTAGVGVAGILTSVRYSGYEIGLVFLLPVSYTFMFAGLLDLVVASSPQHVLSENKKIENKYMSLCSPPTLTLKSNQTEYCRAENRCHWKKFLFVIQLLIYCALTSWICFEVSQESCYQVWQQDWSLNVWCWHCKLLSKDMGMMALLGDRYKFTVCLDLILSLVS